MAIDIVGRTI